MKAISLYIQSLKGLLELYHRDCEVQKPDMIYRAKMIARAAMVISLFSKDKEESIIDVCSGASWLENIVGGNCYIAELILNLSSQEKEIINFCSEILDKSDISKVYEEMLSVDTVGFEIVEGKGLRNQLGSYYSPEELVSCLTQISIDNYIRINGIDSLTQAKIVDFSCGAGAFLVSALMLILRKLPGIYVDKLIPNIYACDVDIIALELAKLNIIELNHNYSNYKVLSNNFHHANFLMHGGSLVPENADKLSLSMKGYIYHPSLAIGFDFLKEYDIILGNPPWEKIRFEEKKFYAQFSKEVLTTNFKFDLASSIQTSETANAGLKSFVDEFRLNLELCKKNIKESLYFADSSAGELNTSTLFADACFKQKSEHGIVGIIIKSSSVLSPANKNFFKKIRKNIIAIYDFINTNKYFDIDSRERYCFLILGKANFQERFLVGMNLTTIADIESSCIYVSNKDLALINPETKMLPNIISSKELELVLKIYQNHRTIGQVYPDLKYGRIVHFTAHVEDLTKNPQEDTLPVYEGKFFSSFDGMYSGFNAVEEKDRYKNKASTKKLTEEDKRNNVKPLSRFFIKKGKWEKLSRNYNADYMLAWHSLTSSKNSRTCVATILPFMPASQSVQFLITDSYDVLIYLSCLFNSVVFDFVIKNKLTGIDLTQTVIKQMPIPLLSSTPQKENRIYKKMVDICYTLLYPDDRMNPIWKSIGTCNLLTNNREDLFVQLDSLIGYLYGLDGEELQYIAGKYPNLYTPERVEKLLTYFTAIS